ncbi:hypothetical protein M5X19_04055 [Paenibacillus alginolyticus]|uniref:Uncharacterized protein n=2 Tax=Paenibacillus alginolyticus TaxID=59839 RepID=A0ABT4G7D7_9BACL|nr:hypothetical protein [Paenibacillus alginolyticus]
MVIPAFYLFYIFASKVNWKSKLKVLAGASAVLIALSISWAVIVDSFSADSRMAVVYSIPERQDLCDCSNRHFPVKSAGSFLSQLSVLWHY